MDIEVRTEPQSWFYSLRELLQIAFPEAALLPVSFFSERAHRLDLRFTYTEAGLKVKTELDIAGNCQSRECLLKVEATENLDKRNARGFVYEYLSDYLQRDLSPYGILTGVRPLKVVHRMLDMGLDKVEIIRRLMHDYHINPAKAQELSEVALYNRRFLLPPVAARRIISLYIGIPFCPSRCYYCSFPGAILKHYDQEIPAFLEALYRESRALAELANQLGYRVENLYLGGGTPVILNAADLDALLTHIKQEWSFIDQPELTVEAGRPDVITEEKLQVMRRHQISRICINPQTMHGRTLRLVGRKHQVQDIVDAYRKSKAWGFTVVNMDVILGLPHEDSHDYHETLQALLHMRPENITVHSLAVKRGSSLAAREGTGRLEINAAAVKAGIAHFRHELTAAGYIPYYLYRQKYMKANLENTGFALPGTACRYNVQMMEERQTILGLGAAASSKFFNSNDGSLSVTHNPKDPYFYKQNLDKCIQSKVDKLSALN